MGHFLPFVFYQHNSANKNQTVVMQGQPDLSYMLSGTQLKQLVPESKIFLHNDLAHLTDISQLFPDAPLPNVAFILYEGDKGGGGVSGHWVLVIDQGDDYLVQDSYGGSLQQQWKYVKDTYREMPYLAALLMQSGKPVHNNNVQFQSKANNVNTCGFHAVLRAWLEDMTNKEYHAFIKSASKGMGMTPDQLVSWLVTAIGRQKGVSIN